MQGCCTLQVHLNHTPWRCHRSPVKECGNVRCLLGLGHTFYHQIWNVALSSTIIPTNHGVTITRHQHKVVGTSLRRNTPIEGRVRWTRRIHDDAKQNGQPIQTCQSHASKPLNKYQDYKRVPGTSPARSKKSLMNVTDSHH